MESTPPLTKKKTFRSPAVLPDPRFDRGRSDPWDPSRARNRQISKRKLDRISLPPLGMDHLGMKLHAPAGASRGGPWPPPRRCRSQRAPEPGGHRCHHGRDGSSRPGLAGGAAGQQSRAGHAGQHAPARTRLVRPCCTAPPSHAPSVAAHSRCPAPLASEARMAGSMRGAACFVNAAGTARDDHALAAGQFRRGRFAGTTPRRTRRGREPCGRSDGNTARPRPGR